MNTHKIYGHMEAFFVTLNLKTGHMEQGVCKKQNVYEPEYKVKMLKNGYGYLLHSLSLHLSTFYVAGRGFVFIRE